MAIRNELVLRLPNSPGALGRVCQLLADGKVGIQAMSLEPTGKLRLVVDNPLSAAGILTDMQYAVDQRDVLFIQLPNDAGGLFKATRLLSNVGINVEYAYGSSPDGQAMAAVVVGVDDVQHASMAAGV